MNIRNFWATIEADDRTIETGPKYKDGSIHVEIKQRSEGDIVTAYTIVGTFNPDNQKLCLGVYDTNGVMVHSFVTTR